MGVCAIQHRISTGRYNSNRHFSTVFNGINYKCNPNRNLGLFLIKCFCLVLYMYIISITMAMYIDVVHNSVLQETTFNVNIIIPHHLQNIYNNSILNSLINLGYLTLMAYILNMYFLLIESVRLI